MTAIVYIGVYVYSTLAATQSGSNHVATIISRTRRQIKFCHELLFVPLKQARTSVVVYASRSISQLESSQTNRTLISLANANES
jgi:hypothetical protein